MILKAYLETLPRGGPPRLAAELGISGVYLFQLAARQNGREPSPELCVRIERATGGAVSRRDLRPADWRLIWPELIEDDAPRADRRNPTRPSPYAGTDLDRRAPAQGGV